MDDINVIVHLKRGAKIMINECHQIAHGLN